MASTDITILVRFQWSTDKGATWHTETGDVLTIPGAVVPPVDPPTGDADYAPQNLTVDVTTKPGSALLTWDDGPSGAPEDYVYSRDGSDLGGAGPWQSAPQPATKHDAELDKLIPGATYRFTVEAGKGQGFWTASVLATIPLVIPPVITPPTGRTEPLAGKSGLGFNSIRFDGGSPSQTSLARAGIARGRSYDGALWFLPRNNGWGEYTKLSNYGDTPKILAAGGIVVTSLPHAPENLGNTINAQGAKDAYQVQQVGFGAFLAANGMNTRGHALRPNWEFNGDWYVWSVANGGAAVFAAAFRNFVTNVRAGGADKVLIDLCANMPSVTGADWGSVWPGDEFVDIIGIDQYDMYPASFTQATWNAKQAQKLSMAGAAQFARSKGKTWALDEGGNAHSKDGGNDNPAYWRYQRATLELYRGNVAHHNTYDEGGTGGLDHTLTDNPNSFAVYKTLYGGQAT